MCEATAAAAIDDGGGRRRWTSAAAVTSTSVLSTATATTDNNCEGERCKGSSRLPLDADLRRARREQQPPATTRMPAGPSPRAGIEVIFCGDLSKRWGDGAGGRPGWVLEVQQLLLQHHEERQLWM